MMARADDDEAPAYSLSDRAARAFESRALSEQQAASRAASLAFAREYLANSKQQQTLAKTEPAPAAACRLGG